MRDEIDLDTFKKRLEDRKQELLTAKQGRQQENAPRQLDQARVGRLSRMDAMQQQAMSQATERLAGVELLRIKNALERIESEEYGYCILCDEEIAARRLAFDPSLLTCIGCAQKSENGQ